jgi:hypothetical protein
VQTDENEIQGEATGYGIWSVPESHSRLGRRGEKESRKLKKLVGSRID